MKATAKLQELGQSLWLDNITREMLDSGQLQRYVEEFSITGLTSNPSIFDKAIKSGAYDDEIRHKAAEAADRETLFFELAIEDLRRAADLFAPIHQRTAGVDGWVSLEVSPLLAYDTARSVRAAAELHARAGRENLFIKIPGTAQGLPAIEEATFVGVPVNVTLLFSHEQYLASADAYMRGIERRIEAGLDPSVSSVASVFISRWDAAVIGRVSEQLRAPARAGGRSEDVSGVSTAHGFSSLAATRERRRACATAVVGQHQHQGPRLPRHDVHRRSARAAHDQHDARVDAAGLRRPWSRRRADRG